MSTAHLQTPEPVMPFEQWKTRLIEISAERSGVETNCVNIFEEEAKMWWRDGFSPYCMFPGNKGCVSVTIHPKTV